MTMPGDYSEELVERLTQVIFNANMEEWPRPQTIPADRYARAVLGALSSSGRLVPEGSEVREEWGNVAPSGDSVPAANRQRAEEWQRRLNAPILRRMAIYGPWSPSVPHSGGAMSEQIEFGGMKVTLMTAWMPMSWELQWDDWLAGRLDPDFVARIEQHRPHRLAYEDSLLGWRAIHCTDCDQRLWDVHDISAVTEEER